MSVGPIPASAATCYGIGVNAAKENMGAENQLGSPVGNPPPTTAGPNENSAAMSQLPAPESAAEEAEDKGDGGSNPGGTGPGPSAPSMGGGMGVKGGESY